MWGEQILGIWTFEKITYFNVKCMDFDEKGIDFDENVRFHACMHAWARGGPSRVTL